MEKLTHHWTESSVKSFIARIASDFVLQIEKKLDREEISRSQFASLVNVTEGSVSQFLNDPGNLTLKRSVQYARALGMKVAIVAYEDDDPSNANGPINCEIFSRCWELAGKPQDFFDIEESPVVCTLQGLQGEAGTVDFRSDINISVTDRKDTGIRKAS